MKVTSLKEGVPWAEQLIPKRQDKTVCISRYGAFGDMIQTSTLFKGLREQGYKICINTTPMGFEILRNDPNIDEFLLQNNDHVPNKELSAYWAYLSGKFDKFISLSESIEASLIALPGRRAYRWKKEFRHLVMDVNYLEGQHAIAGTPFKPCPKFYRSKKERKWAEKYRQKLGRGSFVIMWSIAGSSVHKVYPHMDQVMAQMLHAHKNVKFVLVGDKLGQIIEYDWRKEKRVIRKSGKWTIRESLSMAKECDLVIGPETGVMNAVSFEPMPKILILSHSSINNIGKHWLNTYQAVPEDCECYPCHKIHYGFDTCERDEETGTSKCAASINPELLSGRMSLFIKECKERQAA